MNPLGIGAIIDSVGKVASDLITTDKERIELELEGRRIDQAIDLAQMEVNKTEAAHQSVFVAGWRPFIGWVCGVALAYQFVLRPVITWAAPSLGYTVAEMPGLDDNLWELMFGMLGLGGLRSYEKIKLAK